jgi:hypothetical protein
MEVINMVIESYRSRPDLNRQNAKFNMKQLANKIQSGFKKEKVAVETMIQPVCNTIN